MSAPEGLQGAPGPAVAPQRAQELSDALDAVRGRVRAACAAAGRREEDVHLLAVTKFFPAADAAELVRLGVRDLAESRDQEAGPKAEALAHLPEPPRWHFVGQLQSNKAGHVARYADVVHSVDRARLVTALDAGAQRAGRVLDVLLQVNLGGPDAGRRGGAEPGDLAALADRVAQAEALRLRGLMAVAPRDADPRPAFEHLASLHDALTREHPDAGWLSAGMSGDLEEAVAAGATHLRVGSAILGARPAAR